MADIEIVVGEFGDSYDITIYDEQTGAATDLDNFDTITLTVKPTDLSSTTLSVTLSKPGTTGVVRWAILTAHTASITAGDYIAQIDMVDSGISIRRKTKYLSMRVLEKLA
jgi:hypothetical protein